MPKYLLLKHYRGGPEPPAFPPMSEWKEADVAAHIQYQRDTVAMLQERGEFVSAEGLSPEGRWVRFDGPGKPPVTDGPFPESKELIAGWFLIDVDSEERALEIAAHVSSAPGPDGKPIFEWLELRQVMEGPPSEAG